MDKTTLQKQLDELMDTTIDRIEATVSDENDDILDLKIFTTCGSALILYGDPCLYGDLELHKKVSLGS